VNKINNQVDTCDNFFKGIDIYTVKRNNQIFSYIRKLN